MSRSHLLSMVEHGHGQMIRGMIGKLERRTICNTIVFLKNDTEIDFNYSITLSYHFCLEQSLPFVKI